MSVRTRIKKARDKIEKARKESIKRTKSLIAGLTGIPSSDRDKRGFVAEEKALKAAKYWAGKGIISRVRIVKRLSPEDMAGIDLVLTLLDGREIKVQVKNHYDFSSIQKCQRDGISPFIIWPDDKEDIARERMLALILSAYIIGLSLPQIRQTVRYILKIKQPQGTNWFGRILSRFRKAS